MDTFLGMDVAYETKESAGSPNLSLLERFVGCSAREAAHHRRLARELGRQAKAQALSAKAANRASAYPCRSHRCRSPEPNVG
jgi:hypothetical protein